MSTSPANPHAASILCTVWMVRPRGLTRLSGEIHSGYLSDTVVAERWALSCHSVDDTPEVFLISS